MNDDIVTNQLRRRLEHCLTPRRHRTITDRWAANPALAGIGIHDMLTTCRRSTIEQNPIVGALISLHQSGDDDATTVLLSACRPILYGIVHHARRTADATESEATNSANYWTALSHVLATMDPSPPVDADGRPKPFLAQIGVNLFGARKQIDASERRRHRFNRAENHPTRPRNDDTISQDDNRIVALTDDIIDEQHDRRWANEIHDLEQQVLCRLELTRIADAVRSGAVSIHRWQRLVEHRIASSGASSGADRIAVHRTSTKLAELVDHAA